MSIQRVYGPELRVYDRAASARPFSDGLLQRDDRLQRGDFWLKRGHCYRREHWGERDDRRRRGGEKYLEPHSLVMRNPERQVGRVGTTGMKLEVVEESASRRDTYIFPSTREGYLKVNG